MSSATSRQLRPADVHEAARALADASAAGQAVSIVGAGTKAGWGGPAGPCDVELSTAGLDRVREHNAGDLTAVLDAGVPLSRAQEVFAAEGQRLALDPWLGAAGQATIGGILATADAGPLRHRYGGPRDLVLGMTVVLSDGAVASSGGKVIKNVAGYDLAKLFCGSFGTLGLIASVNVRLHPRPAETATALGGTGDPSVLAHGARGLAGAPLELEALDVRWESGQGTLLAQCGGAQARSRAERALGLMRSLGLTEVEVVDADDELWAGQRSGQRAPGSNLIRLSVRPGLLGGVLDAVHSSGARLVGRAALGLSFIEAADESVERLLTQLPAGARWAALDVSPGARERVEPWGPEPSAAALELMRRVKARFDPARTCNPGIFVGGI
ncbi:MAG: FAD-binding oxidoreductase [Solirubrobacteraceae bacterium]